MAAAYRGCGVTERPCPPFVVMCRYCGQEFTIAVAALGNREVSDLRKHPRETHATPGQRMASMETVRHFRIHGRGEKG